MRRIRIGLTAPYQLLSYKGDVDFEAKLVGATREEIRETLIHTILYCGFPAAFDAFEITERSLSD